MNNEIKVNAVYKVVAVSKLLKCDRSAIYKAVKSGKLPALRIGKGYRFLGQDILIFIRSHYE